MSGPRAPGTQTHSEASAEAMPSNSTAAPRGRPTTGVERMAPAPRSLEEAEAQYVVARDAWTAAMRRASSGRPSDLASLAIAQEAYEMASAQREGWPVAQRSSIPGIDRSQPRAVEAIARQDLAWRQIRESPRRDPRPRGRIARLARRLIGRG